jgi:XTP/dITP diphosphohydrolase
MKKLLFATGNKNKVIEIRDLLKDLPYEVITMGEIGFTEDIPETGDTLQENAILKAQYLFSKTKQNVIAEDTGLEVDILDGAPGVYTARYGGEKKDPIANMNLLIENLSKKTNRAAQFRTVIALILEGKMHTFEGIVRGTIALQKSGAQGFGYDPIFIPEDYSKTFAEMGLDIKSTISHRARAMQKMIQFLDQ